MRVTAEVLGAWVIKCNPAMTDFGSILQSGRGISAWCVADNYRSALMDAGQPVVLWVSGGRGGEFARGIWGIGRVRAPAMLQMTPVLQMTPGSQMTAVSQMTPGSQMTPPGSEPAVRSRHAKLVAQLDIPVRKSPIAVCEIAAVPALSGIEVIRQPYMSNPSWLSKDEFAALDVLL